MQPRQRTALLLAVLVGLVAVQAAVVAVGTTGLATAAVGNGTVTEPTDAVDTANTTDIEGTPPTATVPGTPTSVEVSTEAGSGTEGDTATATESTETTPTATPTSTPRATHTATPTTTSTSTGDATDASDPVTNTTNETTGSAVPTEDDATEANESTETPDDRTNETRTPTATPTDSTADSPGSNGTTDSSESTTGVENTSEGTTDDIADEPVNDTRAATEPVVNETANASERSVAAGMNSTGDTVEEANGTVQTRSDSSRESVEETVNETSDTVEETDAGVVKQVNQDVEDDVDATTSNATDRVVDSVDDSTGTVDDATTELVDAEGAVEGGTVGPIADDTNETVDVLNGTVTGTTTAVGDVYNAADGTIDESTSTVSDAAADTTRTLGDVAGDTAASVGGLTDGATGSVAEVVDSLSTTLLTDELARPADDGAAVLGRTDGTLSRPGADPSNAGLAATDRLATDGVRPASLTRSSRTVDQPDRHRRQGVERHGASIGARTGPDRSPAHGVERFARDDGPPGDGLPDQVPPAAGVFFGAVAMTAAVGRFGGSAVGWFSLAQGGSWGLQTRLAAGSLRGWLGRVPRLLPIPGYSRYDDSDPLANDRRARLYEAVTETPGLDLATLVERTGVSRSTARYHLRVLEHEGQVTARTVRGRHRLYPTDVDDVERHAAVRDESTQAVLEAVARHEPASGTTLAEALGRDPSTVTHHLSRLAEAGLVDRERDGRAVVNRTTPAARSALRPAAAASAGTRRAVESDD